MTSDSIVVIALGIVAYFSHNEQFSDWWMNMIEKKIVFKYRDNMWSELKFSAAGEHLKGFLNGKQYNHGHAETRGVGKVGIMLDGEGEILLKKLTLIPLKG